MELTSMKDCLSKLIFKEARPFVAKKEINWPTITKLGGITIVLLVILLLLVPSSDPVAKTFHEKADPGFMTKQGKTDLDQVPDALALLNKEQGLYTSGLRPSGIEQASNQLFSGKDQRERNAAMIVSRSGFDAKNQLPPGTRIAVRLMQKVIVANQGMPVIAEVTKEVISEDSVAIAEGSKLLGEISFDDSADRAQINWRTIQFADGRERPLSGIGVSFDGQTGIEGEVHSNGYKNTAGQLVTRFIGAYAEGSMQKGAFGASDGGRENGLKNAIAETAKDRGENWADGLKTQKRWIEVGADQEFFAVINQPFTFRDAGSTNGH